MAVSNNQGKRVIRRKTTIRNQSALIGGTEEMEIDTFTHGATMEKDCVNSKEAFAAYTTVKLKPMSRNH